MTALERERRGGVFAVVACHSCARHRKSPVVLFPSSRSGRLREAAHRDDGGHPPTSADLVRARCPESAAGLWERTISTGARRRPGEGFDFADFADDELTPAETCARIGRSRWRTRSASSASTTGTRRHRVLPLRWSSRSSDARAASSPRTPPSALAAFRVPAGAIAEFVYTTPVDPLPTSASEDAPRAPHTLGEHRCVTQRGLYYLLATSTKPSSPPPRSTLPHQRLRRPPKMHAPRRGRPPPDADKSPEASRSEAPRDIRATSLSGRHLTSRDIAAVEDPAGVSFQRKVRPHRRERRRLLQTRQRTGVGSSRDGARDRQGIPRSRHARVSASTARGGLAQVLALDWNLSGLLILQRIGQRRRGARGWAIRARRRVAGGSVRGSERRAGGCATSSGGSRSRKDSNMPPVGAATTTTAARAEATGLGNDARAFRAHRDASHGT